MVQSFRVVFMGTPAFAVPTLQRLLESEFSVVGVVCQPDRPKGRGQKITWGPIKELAMAQDIPVIQPEKMKASSLMETLQGWNPDVIVVAAFGRILPKAILDLPPHRCLNVHGSLLPKYRGAAPIQWAVMNGETETGITIMLMDEGMDTGDILRQSRMPIGPEDTAGDMAPRLAELGGTLLVQTLGDWLQGKIHPQPQEEEKATMAPLLTKEEGRIDWTQSARVLAHRIRGLSPWPGGYTFYRGERWGVWKVRIPSQGDASSAPGTQVPGTVVQVSKSSLTVQTGEGVLDILEIQPANKKRMAMGDYLTGHTIERGTIFSQE